MTRQQLAAQRFEAQWELDRIGMIIDRATAYALSLSAKLRALDGSADPADMTDDELLAELESPAGAGTPEAATLSPAAHRRPEGATRGTRMTRPYTQAQLRALDWLPSDGSWRLRPGKTISALNSLSLSFRKLVDSEWGDFGPRGGRELRWRLTEAGIAAKKAIETVKVED